jgi:hypothetical protein
MSRVAAVLDVERKMDGTFAVWIAAGCRAVLRPVRGPEPGMSPTGSVGTGMADYRQTGHAFRARME